MRLTLLRTSPRVAAGLLTRAAWRAVEAADRVVTDDEATAVALRAEGVAVEHLPRLEELLDPSDATAASGPRVVLLVDTDAAEALVDRLPEGTEQLLAAYDVPGARLLDLVTVMDRLRTECPWDREQTHRSLATYLLEESYETLEAIDSGDPAHLREELGDLLLQVFFHARIAAEQGDRGFDIDDVARGITDKLVYRHPHVFAGLEVADADEVSRNWESLKDAEKKRDSLLDGIPVALPALAYADKVVGRLTRAGLLPAGTAGTAAPGTARRPGHWGSGCWRWWWPRASPGSTPSRSCGTPSAASSPPQTPDTAAVARHDRGRRPRPLGRPFTWLCTDRSAPSRSWWCRWSWWSSPGSSRRRPSPPGRCRRRWR